MKRRTFLRTTAFAAIATSLARTFAGSHSSPILALDQYGGWTGKKFEASGYFRIEKEERWWIVSPEGNAFLSVGINHLHADWWRESYNQKTWENLLGISNAQDWKEFSPALRSWFLKQCEGYGFNTVGVHNSLDVINTPHSALPYMQPIHFVDIPHWKDNIPDENFLDVYADSFARHCDELAKKIALPAKDDPYLLAYSMTDCPLFTEEDCRERTDIIGGARREGRIGWPRRLRNLGPEYAGKQAYVRLMKHLYRNEIQAFNQTYETQFDSFDALATAKQWRPHTDLSNPMESRDNVEFLQATVRQYYSTAKQAIQRYDPNHLFVGDKLNANTDSVDTLLPITAEFTDILLYQMYGLYEVQKPGLDRWAAKVDQPIINGDSAYTLMADVEAMPRPFGPIADSNEQRAAWTREFFEKAFARPEFVGWHYCGLIDTTVSVPGKEGRQHTGFMDGFGKPYPLVQDLMKDCSARIYEIALGR